MSKNFNIESLIEQLTLDEKISLLSGHDNWHTVAIPRLGIPSIRVSDGPNGVRGTKFFNGLPSACLPAATGLVASWDRDLLYKAGELLAEESKAKGAHVLLGPTINIQRSPLGGRGFESFSEDPFLSGILSSRLIKGLQDTGIAATVKHFICNDQETERLGVNAIVSPRALREIYLLPFQIAVRDSNPATIMTSYNKVNGIHASENKLLLGDIVRKEWKWDGMFMSDWTGTYSVSDAINAGLDLEMPGPPCFRGLRLSHAITSKKVTENTLNERVRKVLGLVKFSLNSNIPENAVEGSRDTPETQEFLRVLAANATVLLKNEDQVLPLSKKKNVLVIGPNAKYVSFCGGGSASLRPYRTVSPNDAIKEKVGEDNFSYSLGALSFKQLPPLSSTIFSPSSGKNGIDIRFYDRPRSDPGRSQFDLIINDDSNIYTWDYTHPSVPSGIFYADCEATLIPDETGVYDFGITVCGTAKLFIDGKLIVDNSKDQIPGPSFFASGTIEVKNSIALEKGKSYQLLVEFGCGATGETARASALFGGGVSLGCALHMDPEDAIREAASAAKTAEQVVVFCGLNKEWESEGFDRPNMDLAPNNDKLIEAVLDANSNAVIVIQSGTPVAMPWVDKAKHLIHTSYGGNETGSGVADVLFGDVNPSAKLPLTFPVKIEDNPTALNFGSDKGRVLYGEDVFVGYRYYEALNRPVLFPFGFGLSYTSFKYSDLSAKVETANLKLSVKVSNVGSRDGSEVVQVYISPENPSLRRPIKELKAFDKKLIKSGESQLFEFDIPLKYATSFWDELEDKWASERGKYTVLVGESSASDSMLSTDFELVQTTYWTGL